MPVNFVDNCFLVIHKFMSIVREVWEPKARPICEQMRKFIQESLKCSISADTMRDPVLTCVGRSYDRALIKRWLDGHDIDPDTGTILNSKELIPNLVFKNLIEFFEEIGGRPFELDSLRRYFLCPITHQLMLDPVVTVDGYTYERAAITEYLRHNDCSFVTQELLPHKMVVPDHVLRGIISTYKDLCENAWKAEWRKDDSSFAKVVSSAAASHARFDFAAEKDSEKNTASPE